MKHKILIVSGDPNSINSEIIYKTFKNLNAGIKNKIYIISNFNLLDKQFKKLKLKIKLNDKYYWAATSCETASLPL